MSSVVATIAQDESDPRRAKILDGAMTVFLAYGFQRTTMDDIAKAAEISRPGLYLQFRNKQDIYRALAERFVERVLDAAAEALASSEPLAERLSRTVQTFTCIVNEIEASPHGPDMLDMKTSLAGDIVADARMRMLGLLQDSIAREVGPDRTDAVTSPTVLAGLLLDALDGLKLRRPTSSEQAITAECYARLVAGLVTRPSISA
jgi:AcrR family transcriptional regulator